MVIDPFSGVPEVERNIMGSGLKETIREFATIGGAFILRDDGVLLAAGRHLKASAEDEELPQGLVGGSPQGGDWYHRPDKRYRHRHLGINRGCSGL